MEKVMPVFDYLSLIKRQAKALSKQTSVPLYAFYQDIAVEGGFKNYHELNAVAKTNPDDIRLMRIALQTDELSEVILCEWEVYDGELTKYVLDYDLRVTSSEYDESSGVLTTHADVIHWSDRVYLRVVIRLYRDVNKWNLHHTDPLDIVEDNRPTIEEASTDPTSIHHLFYKNVDPSNPVEVDSFNQTLVTFYEEGVIGRDVLSRLRILKDGVLDLELERGLDIYIGDIEEVFGKDNTKDTALDTGPICL